MAEIGSKILPWIGSMPIHGATTLSFNVLISVRTLIIQPTSSTYGHNPANQKGGPAGGGGRLAEEIILWKPASPGHAGKST
eukprot:scaffold109186_cov42-Attheya_sp.AAC.1